MTREEALKEYGMSDQGEEVINSIFDDIELRKCKNCKHWSKQIHMCDNKESFAYRFHATVLKDDGCNNFKRKVDGI